MRRGLGLVIGSAIYLTGQRLGQFLGLLAAHLIVRHKIKQQRRTT